MTHVPSSTPLTHFKLLSFDVLGTLIDWETGLYNSLISLPPISNLPDSHPLLDRKTLLLAFENSEKKIQKAQPTLEYSKLLSEIFKSICQEHNLKGENIEESAAKFGTSIHNWPAFPDTVPALKKLHEYYKYLVPLTNSSPTTIGPAIKNSLEAFPFTAVYTAADIGSYKPDLKNFHYLLDNVKKEYGVEKGEVLHVAQSLYHDHEPAKKMELESCWVNRGGFVGQVEREKSDGTFGWEVKTLGELAEIVEKAFKEAEGK